MSAAKIIILVLWAVLLALALTQGGSPVGVWSLRILVVLVVTHLIEIPVFFRACQRAGGSLPGHLLNVFVFGIFHMRELKSGETAA